MAKRTRRLNRQALTTSTSHIEPHYGCLDYWKYDYKHYTHQLRRFYDRRDERDGLLEECRDDTIDPDLEPFNKEEEKIK